MKNILLIFGIIFNMSIFASSKQDTYDFFKDHKCKISRYEGLRAKGNPLRLIDSYELHTIKFNNVFRSGYLMMKYPKRQVVWIAISNNNEGSSTLSIELEKYRGGLNAKKLGSFQMDSSVLFSNIGVTFQLDTTQIFKIHCLK